MVLAEAYAIVQQEKEMRLNKFNEEIKALGEKFSINFNYTIVNIADLSVDEIEKNENG